MKSLALLAFSALSLSACAANRTAPIAESGYAPGALAVAAIERQDWARAEQLLTDTSRGNAEDPARLINLGEVYWRTGREGEALTVWRRALASGDNKPVETAGGRMVTTEQLAREALAAHGASLRTAAR